MDDVVKQLWSSAVAIFGAIAIIVGFSVDWNPFLVKWVPDKWRKHPQFKWMLCCLIGMTISLHYIWSIRTIDHDRPPATHQPATKTESKVDVVNPDRKIHAPALEQKKPVLNEQAEKMATEFEYLIGKVTAKTLSNYEQKWYSEYLSATMPAKIEAICGTEECRIYEHLLRRLKSNSGDIQLHFRGLHPFVTKKRYLAPDTPLAGPVITFDHDTAPNALPQDVTKHLETLGEARAPQVLPTESMKPVEQRSRTPSAGEDHRVLQAKHEDAETLLPPRVTSIRTSQTQLDKFMKEGATVTCRRCGQVHQMTKGYFATYDHHICARCGITMSTVDFSKKMASERDKIIASKEDP